MVARALRLRHERLGRLAEEAPALVKQSPAPEFVEIQLAAEDVGGAGSTFVHFEAPDGRRLQLEVPSTALCDVGAIFAAFSGRPR